jgi:hypothetical protein
MCLGLLETPNSGMENPPDSPVGQSRKEVNRHMKHTKMVSRPTDAAQVAWVEWKNIFGPLPLSTTGAAWLVSLIDNKLQG